MKIMALTGVPQNVSELPEWYLLPDSAILKSGNPFFIPEFDKDFRGYPALIIKLSRLGKSISPRFAHRYFEEVALGMMLRGEESLSKAKEMGLPWTKAVAFDRCAFVGEFRPSAEIADSSLWKFSVDEEVLECQRQYEELHIGEVIANLSENNTMKMGDLIMIPLSDTGARLRIGGRVEVCNGDEKLLEVRIK